MKKIFQKKIYFRPTDPIFSRYETGTTGIFFTPKAKHLSKRCQYKTSPFR